MYCMYDFELQLEKVQRQQKNRKAIIDGFHFLQVKWTQHRYTERRLEASKRRMRRRRGS